MVSVYTKKMARKSALRAFPVVQPCEVCGSTQDINRHHDDYTKPLEIRWLCSPCHWETHVPRAENQSIEAFKALRVSAGLSQRKLAKLMCVWSQSVSNWETGKAPIPARAVDFLVNYLQEIGKIHDISY